MPKPIIVRLCSNGDYWQARWVLPGGRRVSRSIGAKSGISRRAAELECHKLAREVEKSATVRLGEKAPTLGDFVERCLSGMTHLRASTLMIQQLVVRRMLAFWGKDRRIDTIKPASAFEFRDWLATKKFRRGGPDSKLRTLSEPSVSRHLTVARHIFKRAVDEDIIARNQFRPLKIAQVRSDKAWAEVSMVELERIFEACGDHPNRCLFALARLAGLRQGEAMRLAWEDIHFDRGFLVVRGIATIKTTKSYTRQTPIQPRLAEVLLAAREAAPEGSKGPCDGLLKNNLYRRVNKILTLAGVPHYKKPFHTLRKNLVTDWMTIHPPLAVASWLGHDIRVAFEFYHRCRPEVMAKVTHPEGTKPAQPTEEKAEN